MDRSRSVRRAPRPTGPRPVRSGSREDAPHAPLPTASHPASPSQIVGRLQHVHGNAHVQRTLHRWRADRAPSGAAVALAPEPAVMRDDAKNEKAVDPPLLTAFLADFPDCAGPIRASAEAVKLVAEAQAAKVNYGGFAEDGPAKNAWPYTVGDSVYIPKAHRADKITAISDFLFEINNAIREPTFAKIHAEAAKGSKGSLTAKTYAYKKVEQEVEGMLRLGKVWFEMKKQAKGTEWDSHDDDFYLDEYRAFSKGKKTKDDLIKDVLGRTYTSGDDAGKTVEAFYMHQYDNLSGGK